MRVEKLERKPKSAGRCGWDELSDIWCALFLILLSAFLIFHLVILYIHGSVLVFEHSRSMAIFEGILLFAFIALALDKLRRLWRTK
jgi:hypothetical protein